MLCLQAGRDNLVTRLHRGHRGKESPIASTRLRESEINADPQGTVTPAVYEGGFQAKSERKFNFSGITIARFSFVGEVNLCFCIELNFGKP